jgi:hypothetical protein
MIAFVSLSGRSTILYKKEFRFIRIFMRVQHIVDSHCGILDYTLQVNLSWRQVGVSTSKPPVVSPLAAVAPDDAVEGFTNAAVDCVS